MSKFLDQLISIKTALVSAIETVGIAVWKALLATVTFALTGNGPLAVGVLAAGFILEHIVSFLFRGQGTFPVLRLLGVAAVETVTWSGWLALTAVDPILAAIVLFAGLWVGHGLEQNTIRGCPGFLTRVIRGETLDITAIETGVAVIWLALLSSGPYLPNGLIANIVLFVGLQIEHALSNAKTRVCYER
jgi:hypothetical protein